MATWDGRPDAVREQPLGLRQEQEQLRGLRPVPEHLRGLRQEQLRGLLEARQRRLRARIAACEELTAEMGALLTALREPQGPGLAGGARLPSPSLVPGEPER